MYAVTFTRFEKPSWFSLRPTVRATHDNQLFFVNTDNAFVHLHCSTQSIMKKVLSFHLVLTLHLHPYRIGRVKRKKVELYKTFYLRCCAFCLRNMDERFHHSFTCVVTGPANCGKTEFVAKFIQHVKQMMTPTPQRIVWCYGERQRLTVPICHWSQNVVSMIKYTTDPTISALEFITEGKTFYVIFIFSSIFVFYPSYIFELLQHLGMSCFDLIHKHPHRCTTDDGAKLYVYVTMYAAIRCKGKSGRATQLNPALSTAASLQVRNYSTEKRSIWTVKSRAVGGL